MLTVHTDDLADGETQRVGGMRVTTAARTGFDIGRRVGPVSGVQRLDALMNATDVKLSDIDAVAAMHPGVRGLTRLRRALDLVDGGAESPWESLTRLLFVRAEFPRPETQIPVFDEYGVLVAVIDMGWRDYLVGVDFEGAHHWTNHRQRHWDVGRFTRLPELGWQDFRVTSRIVSHASRGILNRVGAALVARGCPKTW